MLKLGKMCINNVYKKWGVEEIPVYNLYDVTNKAETLICNQLQTLREWKEKKTILLVSYSQFSSIVCEKSENQMTQSCHYRRNKSSRDVVSPKRCYRCICRYGLML